MTLKNLGYVKIGSDGYLITYFKIKVIQFKYQNACYFVFSS